MSLKSKVFATAAALTMVGGLGAAGALTANAATPSCGHSCIELFSQEFGSHHSPNFIVDTWRGTAKAGTPVILFRTSNSDAAEDFTVSFQGTVADFYAAGLVSATLDLHYSHLAAFEFQYSPDGVNTGLCLGTASTATDGTPVTLQSCGDSSKTVWVVDSYDTIKGGYVPLINGSDTNFSDPYVLHYPGNSYPTDNPRPVLNTYQLQKYSNNAVYNNEMWGADYGILP